MQKIHSNNNNNKNTMNTKTNTDTVYELAYSRNRKEQQQQRQQLGSMREQPSKMPEKEWRPSLAVTVVLVVVLPLTSQKRWQTKAASNNNR